MADLRPSLTLIYGITKCETSGEDAPWKMSITRVGQRIMVACWSLVIPVVHLSLDMRTKEPKV